MSANGKSHVYDTIILGAGVSGLACASRLVQHATKHQLDKSILVLEARDRIGGRVGTVQVNGCRLDTGANWIHGVGTKERPNPLMDILPSKRVKELSGSVAFEPPSIPSAGTQNGEEGWEIVSKPEQSTTSASDLVIPPETAGPLLGVMWELLDALHETANSTPAEKAKATTMLKAMSESEVFRDTFDEVPEEYHEVLRAMPQFIEGMEAAPLVAQSAEGKEDAPGMGLLEYAIDDFDGEQVFVQDGYLAVLEELGKDVLCGGLVELEAEVESIDWSSSPLTIRLKDGKSYEANNVVCTLPLGVLKAHHTTLFQPPLPEAKQDSIASLGFGTLDKVFLVYSHPWWTQGPYSTIIQTGLVELHPESQGGKQKAPDMLIGFTNDLPGLALHRDGTSEPGMRVLSLINLHSLTGFPVLSCFVSCANAVHLESLPDAEVQELIHSNLSSWFGQETPKPEAVHVTRWASDPFSRGSYSHMICGKSETRHREEFQEAVDGKDGGRLAFAGEHTSRSHFATVHGALISGWREADAVIKQW